MFSFFDIFKRTPKTEEEQLIKVNSEHIDLIQEYVELADQYKMMTVRGIVVMHNDGEFHRKITLPESIQMDIYRKLTKVGVLCEADWYNTRWIYDSTVETIRIDYSDMEEIYVVDAVEALQQAMDRARINGHMELVIYGSPVLINILLPFMDSLEVYVNKLTPTPDTITCNFGRMLNANASAVNNFTIGNANLVKTREFNTKNYMFYNLINLKRVEIKSDR